MASKPPGNKRRMVKFKLTEISLVGNPAQDGAGGVIMKSMDKADETPTEDADDTQADQPGDDEQEDSASEPEKEKEKAEAQPETGKETPPAEKSEEPQNEADSGKESEMSKEAEDTVTKEAHDALQKQLDDQKAELEKAQADLARSTKVNELSADQREYFNTLEKEKQDTFLEASDEDRKVDMDLHKENADSEDPVEYTTDDGIEIRKSAGKAMLTMAKKNDLMARQFTKMQEEKEELEFTKEADEKLGHLHGGSEVRTAILRAVTKGVEDEDLRKQCIDSLSIFDKDMKMAFKTFGVSRESDLSKSDDPDDQLDALAKEYAKEHKMDVDDAYIEVLNTPRGQELAEQSLAN